MNTRMQKHVRALGIVYLKDAERGHINADKRFGSSQLWMCYRSARLPRPNVCPEFVYL